jgi:hypothetical protein
LPSRPWTAGAEDEKKIIQSERRMPGGKQIRLKEQKTRVGVGQSREESLFVDVGDDDQTVAAEPKRLPEIVLVNYDDKCHDNRA